MKGADFSVTVKELVAALEKFPSDEEVYSYMSVEEGSRPGWIYYVGRSSCSGKLIIGVADEDSDEDE